MPSEPHKRSNILRPSAFRTRNHEIHLTNKTGQNIGITDTTTFNKIRYRSLKKPLNWLLQIHHVSSLAAKYLALIPVSIAIVYFSIEKDISLTTVLQPEFLIISLASYILSALIIIAFKKHIPDYNGAFKQDIADQLEQKQIISSAREFERPIRVRKAA